MIVADAEHDPIIEHRKHAWDRVPFLSGLPITLERFVPENFALTRKRYVEVHV
jgi:hypothetical protein